MFALSYGEDVLSDDRWPVGSQTLVVFIKTFPPSVESIRIAFFFLSHFFFYLMLHFSSYVSFSISVTLMTLTADCGSTAEHSSAVCIYSINMYLKCKSEAELEKFTTHQRHKKCVHIVFLLENHV